MTLATLDHPVQPRTARARCEEGTTPQVFQSIKHPEVNLAVWKRNPLPDLTPALEAALTTAAALRLDMENPGAGDLFSALQKVPVQALEPSLRAWADDILRLATIFRDAAGLRHFRIRIERVEDDGCALFHEDSLKVRMLCTYAGPGTQWLEEDNVRREELGLRMRSLPEANAAIVIDASRIREIPAWHVAMFKGRNWEGSLPLVHRSSPVSSRDAFRLRLCVDLAGSCGC